jgi:GDSL-like Lipase/Acylhydrolase family
MGERWTLRDAARRLAPAFALSLLPLLAPPANADWRSAPVVPRISPATEKQTERTLRRGRALGNRANVLAKVGDSITQSPAFLHPLGCGQWKLGRYHALRPTIKFFSQRGLPGRSTECRRVNSFSRNSAAALLARPSAWAIQPGGAVDPACRSGESPLACEIRIDRPSFAVILLGTNDVTIGDLLGADPTPDFVRNMRIIVRTARRLGVVPILNTLPPRTDTAQREALTEHLNANLTALARAERAPLINLWRALDRLPHRGLWDGLHLSVSGWPGCPSPCDPNLCAPNCYAANFGPAGLMYGTDMRNLITLQTLRRVSAASRRG